MKCKNCYSNIPDNSQFCKFCGCCLNENSAQQQDCSPPPAEIISETPETASVSPKNHRGIIISIAVFAGILIFFLNFLFSTRIGFGSDMVKSRIDSLSIETVLDSEYEDGNSAVEYIYNNMDSHFLGNTNAKLKDLRSFLCSCGIEEFIAVKLSDYAEYIIEGSDIQPSLSAHEITNFVYSRRELFTEEFDYTMDKTDYTELEESLADAGIDDALSVDGLSESIGFNLEYAHYFLSFITLIVIFLLICGCFLTVFLLLKNNFTRIFSFIGIPFISAGALSAVPAIIFFVWALASGDSAVSYIVSGIATPFAAFLGCTGLFEVIAGIILLMLKKRFNTQE